jgi:putative FmdB family regulatory protein
VPIYDYVCVNCGHRMEVIHGVHDRGPALCPLCGGQVKKAFSAPAVLFKGSGWAKKERLSTSSARHKAKEPAKDASNEGGSASGSSGTSGTSGAASASSDSTSGASSTD